MRKTVTTFIALFGFVLLFSTPTQAVDRADCGGLADVMEGMELIAIALENATDLSL